MSGPKRVIVNLAAHHEPFVTVRMLANYWGVNVCTVYRAIKKGALPVYRLPGGSVRIKREDAVAYGLPPKAGA